MCDSLAVSGVEPLSRIAKRLRVDLVFEKFRIREMKAMNNLFLMLSIAVALLTEIIQEGGALWDGVLVAYQPLTDLKEEARIKKEYGYSGLMLYRAAEGVKTILGRAAQRPEVPGRDQRKRYKQLTLFNHNHEVLKNL